MSWGGQGVQKPWLKQKPGPTDMLIALAAMAKGAGREGGRHSGKAFVEFSSEAAAKKAIQTLNGQELDGRALVVDTWTNKEGGKPKEPNKNGNDACKVWIANVAWKTRGWKLKEHFAQCGNIVFYKQMSED